MNNKAHLRPKDFDSNGDIIPMACKEEKGDLISREALRKNMEFICMGIMAGTEPYNAPLTEIDNAPAVEIATKLQQGKWIPVSERLPDFWEAVLVTDECGKVFEYERRPLDDDGNECREWSFLGRKIIAWMPKPEPPAPYPKGEEI